MRKIVDLTEGAMAQAMGDDYQALIHGPAIVLHSLKDLSAMARMMNWVRFVRYNQAVTQHDLDIWSHEL